VDALEDADWERGKKLPRSGITDQQESTACGKSNPLPAKEQTKSGKGKAAEAQDDAEEKNLTAGS